MNDSPEVVAAQARLDALPADLVAPELRSAVLRAAEAVSVHRDASQALDEAVRGAQAALEAGDVSGAAQAAAMIVAHERMRVMLPDTAIDAAPIAAALAVAAQVVARAEADARPMPTVAYSAELAAYRSLPIKVQIDSAPPAVMASDFEAERAVADLQTAKTGLVASIASWRKLSSSPGAAEPLNLLSAAAGVRSAAAEHVKVIAKTTTQVEAANKARSDAGLTWQPPTSGITSPEIRRLPDLVIRAV